MSRWNQSVENIDLMSGQMSILRAVLMEFQIDSNKDRLGVFHINKNRQSSFLIVL